MNRNGSKETAVCDEFVRSVYEEYSVDTIAELLLPSGLLTDKSAKYTGSFEKYVFLQGNSSEIYTKAEIDFISLSDEIVVFKEFFKKTKRGVIPCRIAAVKNVWFETLYFSIAFTKIINKASDGLNICVVVADDGIIFTCRAYEDQTQDAYHISDLITSEEQLAELYDNLMYSSDYEGFIDYYVYLRECIRYKSDIGEYAAGLRMSHKTSYAYIETLQEIESVTRWNFSREIERYFWGMEEEKKETFANKVAECEEYLFKIESSRINTMEMLFEAEEMEKLAAEAEERNKKLAAEAEERNKKLFMQNVDGEDENFDEMDAETKALLDDPESMIKILKKKRGI